MFRNKIKILITVLIFSQVAAGCSLYPSQGGPSAKEVKLVIWGPFDMNEELKPLFDSFRAGNGNVSLEYVKKDLATYEADLVNALAAGAGPDIFAIHNDWLPRYKDKLTPAPNKLFSDRDFTEVYIDVIKDEMFEDGSLYAMPFSVDVLALYYNKDLLGSAGIAVPPRTWEEAVEYSKKIEKQDKYGNFITNGIALGTSGNINRSTDILSLLMLQDGTQVFSPDRKSATLDREITGSDGKRYNPGVQALEFYTQFANPAKDTYTWNARSNYSIDSFVAGQTAMMIGYSYFASTIRSKAPLLNFGVAAVPQIDLSKPKVNYSHYFAFGVSRVSSSSKEAWNFIKESVSKENLEKMYAVRKQVSIRKDIISSQTSDTEIGVFAEGALTAKTFYKPDSAKVEKIFMQMIDDVILKSANPNQAASTANQQLSGLIR